MDVTREDVLRCAALTRLHLEEAEIEPLRRDMERLLTHAGSLGALDLEGVAPWGLDAPLPRREDIPAEGLTQAQALANAPRAERGHFVVPRVLG
ncbi:Asp-tRNA(Asn)/Glu-tRNA(Gln) amidotransferase subunit GatC [Mesoterricola sediminis]|uniref:Aspartyl/glutamyl-tRNA(Asn/Gln) amidotransferase subunit C n=1 Tax=Mesoterricola sediminis TaxID=2927980 RepID=A0AA48GR16_9BACT|nr:Asp-tRNA(Asn)/Glu-tRNA(Gln) amidotransferase subunit GatC [Mesoterricola sediminis]BDU77681.1 glutamyl-tRNA(Gln) amidotransferase subunit C [Mesoterricola sediminis]